MGENSLAAQSLLRRQEWEAIKRRYPNALYTCYSYGGFAGRDGGWASNSPPEDRHRSPRPGVLLQLFQLRLRQQPKDMLTLRLHGRYVEIQEGVPHYLGWLCAGYERKIANYQGDPAQGMYADLPRWMGYLKMSYLAGMLGGITTGEFGCEVRYEPFDPAQPPKWLDQDGRGPHARPVHLDRDGLA